MYLNSPFEKKSPHDACRVLSNYVYTTWSDRHAANLSKQIHLVVQSAQFPVIVCTYVDGIPFFMYYVMLSIW